jgi:hypothetical protein
MGQELNNIGRMCDTVAKEYSDTICIEEFLGKKIDIDFMLFNTALYDNCDNDYLQPSDTIGCVL